MLNLTFAAIGFDAPWMLAFVLPWAAMVLLALAGSDRMRQVSHLPFWPEQATQLPASVSARRLSLWSALLLAALLVGIVASALPTWSVSNGMIPTAGKTDSTQPVWVPSIDTFAVRASHVMVSISETSTGDFTEYGFQSTATYRIVLSATVSADAAPVILVDFLLPDGLPMPYTFSASVPDDATQLQVEISSPQDSKIITSARISRITSRLIVADEQLASSSIPLASAVAKLVGIRNEQAAASSDANIFAVRVVSEPPAISETSQQQCVLVLPLTKTTGTLLSQPVDASTLVLRDHPLARAIDWTQLLSQRGGADRAGILLASENPPQGFVPVVSLGNVPLVAVSPSLAGGVSGDDEKGIWVGFSHPTFHQSAEFVLLFAAAFDLLAGPTELWSEWNISQIQSGASNAPVGIEPSEALADVARNQAKPLGAPFILLAMMLAGFGLYLLGRNTTN